MPIASSIGLRSGASGLVRFLSPTNIISSNTPAATSTTFTGHRSRMPFWIGSADRSDIILSFNGFRVSAAGVVNFPNAYTVTALTIEKDSDGNRCDRITVALANPVTVNPGDVNVQVRIRPNQMGTLLTKFTFGDKYWLRMQIEVATAASFPTGELNFNGAYPASIALVIDPASNTAGPVSGTGNMVQGNGTGGVPSPYQPIFLGTMVSGDAKTFFITGDSIPAGQGDTTNATVYAGGEARALFDADGVSNALGGLRVCVAGTLASQVWQGSTVKPAAFMKYAKYLWEEFGTNNYLSAPGSTPASAIADSQIVWNLWLAAGNTASRIMKPKIIPRVTTTDSYVTVLNQSYLNTAWGPAGADPLARARAFNDAVDTALSNTLIGVVVPMVGTRASAVASADDFYHWIVNGTANYATADGTHPTPAGHLLRAADVRAAFAAVP